MTVALSANQDRRGNRERSSKSTSNAAAPRQRWAMTKAFAPILPASQAKVMAMTVTLAVIENAGATA